MWRSVSGLDEFAFQFASYLNAREECADVRVARLADRMPRASLNRPPIPSRSLGAWRLAASHAVFSLRYRQCSSATSGAMRRSGTSSLVLRWRKARWGPVVLHVPEAVS
jgi:hypothetical protein